MIVLFVVAQSDEIVRIEGTMDLEQRGRGYVRTSVSPGKIYYGVAFDEWRTLCGIDVADDGTVTKYPRGPGLASGVFAGCSTSMITIEIHNQPVLDTLAATSPVESMLGRLK